MIGIRLTNPECPKCKSRNTGYIDCDECDGEGVDGDGDECDECGGRGLNDEHFECEDCDHDWALFTPSLQWNTSR